VMTSELAEAVFQEADEMDDDARRSTFNTQQTLIALIQDAALKYAAALRDESTANEELARLKAEMGAFGPETSALRPDSESLLAVLKAEMGSGKVFDNTTSSSAHSTAKDAENDAQVDDSEGLFAGLLVPGPPEDEVVAGLYINPVEFAAAFFEVQQDFNINPPPFTPAALVMAQKEIEGQMIGMLSAAVECARHRADVGGEGLPMPAGCDSDDAVMRHLTDVLGAEASSVCPDGESLLAALDRAYDRHTEGLTLVSQPAIMQPKDIQLARRIRGQRD